MRPNNGPASRARKKTMLKRVKGFKGSRSKLFRRASEAFMRAGRKAYRGRRLKKRNFRSLWIARINAAVRDYGLSYSRFMHGLKIANIGLDRKVLSEMAVNNKAEFAKLVEMVRKAA
ncbi:MAG: 50S ribosomal protein L20 [Candidatus Cloacimonetes bacterium]|nr:50S ribosomal protein L20 [Candidatus Cloacimonadota bacterium]